MSDGLLRFVAVATALLTPNRGLDIDPGLTVGDGARGVLLVIEEVENGFHPSQAGRGLQLIKETGSDLAKKVMVTTHCPALLNAMTDKLNRSIIVCYRDTESGLSRLSRLTQLPRYAENVFEMTRRASVTCGAGVSSVTPCRLQRRVPPRLRRSASASPDRSQRLSLIHI